MVGWETPFVRPSPPDQESTVTGSDEVLGPFGTLGLVISTAVLLIFPGRVFHPLFWISSLGFTILGGLYWVVEHAAWVFPAVGVVLGLWICFNQDIEYIFRRKMYDRSLKRRGRHIALQRT